MGKSWKNNSDTLGTGGKKRKYNGTPLKKIEVAFLCRNSEKLREVYGPERMNRISELAELYPEIITDENFETADLSRVECLFSTWGMMSFTNAQLDRMPNLKAVFYAAGATDAFCRPLFARGIHVISAWRANALPVAEFTVAQIILGLKNYFRLARTLHSPSAWRAAQAGPGAYGKTVALLGAGMISSHVQELLKSYDLNVIVVPSRKEKRTISLEEAFATSQVVSNHFPDRTDNVGVLTGKMFASMPKNGVFINTGRARQINEAEFCEVFKARPDLTALLDVTFPEPPPEDSLLYRLPNVFLSPHIAGSLNDEWKRMADFMIDEFKRYLACEPFQHEVNESMLITSKA